MRITQKSSVEQAILDCMYLGGDAECTGGTNVFFPHSEFKEHMIKVFKEEYGCPLHDGECICGKNPIHNVIWVKASNGKRFTVGNQCVGRFLKGVPKLRVWDSQGHYEDMKGASGKFVKMSWKERNEEGKMREVHYCGIMRYPMNKYMMTILYWNEKKFHCFPRAREEKNNRLIFDVYESDKDEFKEQQDFLKEKGEEDLTGSKWDIGSASDSEEDSRPSEEQDSDEEDCHFHGSLENDSKLVDSEFDKGEIAEAIEKSLQTHMEENILERRTSCLNARVLALEQENKNLKADKKILENENRKLMKEMTAFLENQKSNVETLKKSLNRKRKHYA